MARRFKIFSRCEGASAVEFALVLPLLILILCGIIDLGNLYLQWDIVNQAARQAARLYAVDVPNGTMTQATIVAQIQNNYGSQILFNPPVLSSGNVTEAAYTNVTIMTPVISAFFPNNPVTVEGKCTMYVE